MKNYELKILDSEANGGEVQNLEVHGCLDSHTVVPFEKSVAELIDRGVRQVRLNLSQLNYISSAGISALMGLTHQLRKQGGDLVLLRPTEKVYRVFRTLGFTNIFTIAEISDEVRQKT